MNLKEPTTLVVEKSAGVVMTQRVSQLALTDIQTGKLQLNDDQLRRVREMLEKNDFETMTTNQILAIGVEAERNLRDTLEKALSGATKNSAPAVFKLFTKLQDGVKEAQLDAVVEAVHQADDPPFYLRFWRWLMRQGLAEVMEKLQELITGKTQSLTDLMRQLQRPLDEQIRNVAKEMDDVEGHKAACLQHFYEFIVAAAFAYAFHVMSEKVVAAAEAAARPNDMLATTQAQELRQKLTLLYNRAATLDGSATGLPANYAIFQDIGKSGAQTLQETMGTALANYNDICMTLLAIKAIFSVTLLQQLSNARNTLRSQLSQVRDKAQRKMAVEAAEAPGRNALKRAADLEKAVENLKQTRQLVAVAENISKQQTEEATDRYAVMRAALASLN